MFNSYAFGCSPNANHLWDLTKFAEFLYAIRSIPAGEQIYVTSCGATGARAECQEEVLCDYKFICSCTSRSLSEPEAQRGDARRALIRSQFKDLQAADKVSKTWIHESSLSDYYIIDRYKAIWDAMEAEDGCGYPEKIRPGLVQGLCKAYCALGDFEGAREWAQKGARLSKAFTRNDLGWTKVFEGPKNTTWWELKAKSKYLNK